MVYVDECNFPSLGITKQSWWSLGEHRVTMLGVLQLCAELPFSRPSLIDL